MRGKKSKVPQRLYTNPRADLDRNESLVSRDYLHRLQHSEFSDEKDRQVHAREFLRQIAWHLEHRKTLPDEIADWLAQALLKAAGEYESADTALGLKLPRGRQSKKHVTLNRVILMHVLVTSGCNKERAASVIADYFDLSEPSALVKAFNRLVKVWCFNEELFWDRAAQARMKGCPKKLWRHCCSVGWAGATSPAILSSTAIRLSAEFIAHVDKSGVFTNMD